ncbi:uncharacterized protein [Euphorbia lathyris]|uniref:uncharacterized protein n=1 Tax=Euphorbia lathyris TaxID=212925 RepID=UPI00331435D2
MISDSDIVTRLREILRHSNLDTATAGSVRRKLEEDFGVDLSDRKVFIRNQIDIYLETLGNNEEEQDEENTTDNVKQNEEVNDEEGNEEEEGEDEEEEEEDQSKGQETDIERSRKGEKEVKKRGGGFTKPCSLSPKLQKFVGESQLARTQVVKRLWAYIREKDLQDPKNKRNIKCDETLRDLFRVNSINMFQMNKALSKHIWPLTPEAENETLKVKGEDSDSSVSEGDDPGEKEGEEEEEEEEEKEEVEKEKDCSNKRKKRGSAKVDKEVKKRGGGGFSKLCSLSPELQVVTGGPALARTEVVKRIWAYIQENNLQDPNNKRSILCDESMRAIFHVDSIDMFQMNKALSAHILPLNKEDDPDKSLQEVKHCKREREEDLDEPQQKEKQQKKYPDKSLHEVKHCKREREEDLDEPQQKEKQQKKYPDKSLQEVKHCKREREEDLDEPQQKEKQQKKGSSGLLVPLPLSDALANFFGTGENLLSRADAVKRMWEYIKQNDLQDPSDKRRIICDEKLKELFDVESFHGFSVSKLLTSHFIKTEQ